MASKYFYSHVPLDRSCHEREDADHLNSLAAAEGAFVHLFDADLNLLAVKLDKSPTFSALDGEGNTPAQKPASQAHAAG